MKTIISKIINNKVLRFLFNPINISIIIAMFFLIIAVLYMLNEDIISGIKLLFFGFLPLLMLFLFKCISKVCKKTWVFIVLSFSSLAYLLIYLIFLLFLFLGTYNNATQDYVYEYKSPPKEKYYEKISNITSRLYRIEHFPKEIPSNAENYFFKAEKSFDGFDIHYLKFNINDKNYFDQIIKNNKNKIYKKLEYNKVYKHYSDLEASINIEENPNTTLYILKNQNNDLSYTSGFIISKTDNLIVFFYANYCLDTSKDVYGYPLTSSE